MEPTLLEGDRVLVDRGAYRRAPPRVRDLVASVDPEEPTRRLVKRVAAVGPGQFPLTIAGPLEPSEAPSIRLGAGEVFLLSDAPGPTRDSRRFGPMPRSSLLGQVWFRIGPPARRGPL
jgi:hypothetical protein